MKKIIFMFLISFQILLTDDTTQFLEGERWLEVMRNPKHSNCCMGFLFYQTSDTKPFNYYVEFVDGDYSEKHFKLKIECDKKQCKLYSKACKNPLTILKRLSEDKFSIVYDKLFGINDPYQKSSYRKNRNYYRKLKPEESKDYPYGLTSTKEYREKMDIYDKYILSLSCTELMKKLENGIRWKE